MKKSVLLLLLSVLLIVSSVTAEVKAESMISVESSYSVKETADRFEAILKEKGLTLFARVDHQKNAASVDLEIRPTQLIIFGNPKVGTPLMQCAQTVAIDLPQKVLVFEDADKRVWLTYNNPEYLEQRHAIIGCDDVLEKISMVLAKLSQVATAI